MRMQVTSYSELRKNLAAIMDRSYADHSPVLITRSGGKPPMVMMSMEDFGGYAETEYLMRSPANKKILLESLAAADRGEYTVHALIEE
jgi:antitoxin YefM